MEQRLTIRQIIDQLLSEGVLMPLILLMLLWSNLNTVPFMIKTPDSLMGLVNLFRTVAPFIVLFLYILFRKRDELVSAGSPIFWLEMYGWIALVCSAFSPQPWPSFYFGMAFLANIYIPKLFINPTKPYRSERMMMYVTLFMVALFTAGIVLVARNALVSGYNFEGSVDTGGAGMPMSRSSGVARFVSVLGLACLVFFIQSRHWIRFILLVVFAGAVGIVIIMQSRGAMFGLAMSLIFLFWIGPVYLRYIAAAGLLGLVIYWLTSQGGGPAGEVLDYVSRNQSKSEFLTMTGRTRTYSEAFKVIRDHWFLGQGNWADRYTIKQHVHNAFLQALMIGGVVGFIPYILSWITGWILFFRLHKQRRVLLKEDQTLLMICGVILMFFTVRSIPETTTASFSVDSMVMVPVFLYLTSLWFRLTHGTYLVPIKKLDAQRHEI